MWNIWIAALLIGLKNASAFLASIGDPNASDKYLISYLTQKSWEQSIRNNATALSMGKIMQLGPEMSCYVPKVISDSSSMAKELNETEVNAMLTDNLQAGVDIIATTFNKCITYLSGFWNYEYCVDNGFAQFHGNPKTPSLFYVLARPKQSIKDRELQLLYNDFGYYISEIIGSGDICDVTGYPRVVEVQYVCGPAPGAASIQWVRETKTCHYEVQIAIPQLCELELLSKNEDKKMSNPILCVKQQENIDGVVDIIGRYEPIFIGNEFYLLKPYSSGTAENRTALLYAGDHSTGEIPNDQQYKLYEKFGNAISRMLFQQFITSPNGLPYRIGDEFSWISEVLDLKGNFVTMVQFNLSSSSFAEIALNPLLQFTSPGNFIFYNSQADDNETKGRQDPQKQHNLLDTSKLRKDFNSQEKIKLVVIDERIKSGPGDGANVVLDEILSSEKLSAVLEKLEHIEQDSGSQNTLDQLYISDESTAMMENEGRHQTQNLEDAVNGRGTHLDTTDETEAQEGAKKPEKSANAHTRGKNEDDIGGPSIEDINVDETPNDLHDEL